jgi:hypothetical protein
VSICFCDVFSETTLLMISIGFGLISFNLTCSLQVSRVHRKGTTAIGTMVGGGDGTGRGHTGRADDVLYDIL